MKDLVKIANSLNNDDVATLLNILADRLIVFVRTSKNTGSMLDLDKECCTNGALVQITTEAMNEN